MNPSSTVLQSDCSKSHFNRILNTRAYSFLLLRIILSKMLALRTCQWLGFLALSNLAFATRFRFGVEEVNVGLTRDPLEDDALLVIASVTGSGNKTNNWELGSVGAGDSIKWNNLTQEIDVPRGAANLSMAFGIANAPDPDEELVSGKYDVIIAQSGADMFSDIVNGIVTVAAAVPGPQAPAARLLGLALSFLDPFNCTGPVAVGNVIYAQNDLNNMNQNQKTCDSQTYSYDTPNMCGFRNSSYTVKYCLERLDPKPASGSAAASFVPYSSTSFAALGVALLCGSYGLLM
jgi:hypothetical protein